MHTVFFTERLTALELRDPIVAVCEEAAAEVDMNVNFFQHKQAAFERSKPGKPVRIGNGKHWLFEVQFVRRTPNHSNRRMYRPFDEEAIGNICLRAPVDPSSGQYGGFQYEKPGDEEPAQTYSYVTLYFPSELNYYLPKDLPPSLFEASATAIEATLGHPQLF